MKTLVIEVFKTNVQKTAAADALIKLLQQRYPGSMVSFDLEDCDRVLRIEGTGIDAANVNEQLYAEGYYCEVME